jgi:ankyrin repeat protein
MVQLLLDRGADPTRTLHTGESVLDAAAQEGQAEIARILLRHSPDLATEERALVAADHPGGRGWWRRRLGGRSSTST